MTAGDINQLIIKDFMRQQAMKNWPLLGRGVVGGGGERI